MKELRSGKDFLKFIGSFMATGALWLAACYRGIEWVIRRRK